MELEDLALVTALTSTWPTDRGFSLPVCGVQVIGRAKLAFRSNTGFLATAFIQQFSGNVILPMNCKCNYVAV